MRGRERSFQQVAISQGLRGTVQTPVRMGTSGTPAGWVGEGLHLHSSPKASNRGLSSQF